MKGDKELEKMMILLSPTMGMPPERVARNLRANRSEMRARSRYGNKAVDAAVKAALNAGLATTFYEHRHPYPALMKWYRSLKSHN